MAGDGWEACAAKLKQGTALSCVVGDAAVFRAGLQRLDRGLGEGQGGITGAQVHQASGMLEMHIRCAGLKDPSLHSHFSWTIAMGLSSTPLMLLGLLSYNATEGSAAQPVTPSIEACHILHVGCPSLFNSPVSPVCTPTPSLHPPLHTVPLCCLLHQPPGLHWL